MIDLDRILAGALADVRALELTDNEIVGVLAAAGAPRRYRTRRRRRSWLIALVPAAILSGGAAYYATRPSTEQLAVTSIACAANAAADDDMLTIVGGEGRDPIEVCGEYWARGDIDRTTHAIPALVPCSGVGEQGAIVVYPSRDSGVCERVGKVSLPDDYEVVNARFARLTHLTQTGACLSVDQAVARANAEIARGKLAGWKVEVTRADDPERCIGWAIDGDHTTVRVIQSSRLPPASTTAAKHTAAWSRVLRALEQRFPGYPSAGCAPPADAVATVRRAIEGTVLADRPLLVWRVGPERNVGFNARLRCTYVEASTDETQLIKWIHFTPDVPRDEVFPTDAELRRMATEPSQSFGLEFVSTVP